MEHAHGLAMGAGLNVIVGVRMGHSPLAECGLATLGLVRCLCIVEFLQRRHLRERLLCAAMPECPAWLCLATRALHQQPAEQRHWHSLGSTGPRECTASQP